MRLLVLAVTALLCTSCVKQTDPTRTHLQFYLWGGGQVADLEQSVIDAFERENPDIKVELTPVIGAYSEKMQALIVGGILPDVMAVDINSYYEWADRGLLMDITDLMATAQREQHFTFMPIVHDLAYRGRYYVAPYGLSGVIPQVNLDVFRRAGIELPSPENFTWDWIEQVAPRLSRRSGHPDAPVDFFCALPDMTSLLFTFGARVFDDPRHPQKILVNSPQAEEMCRYVRRVVATKALVARAELTKSSDWGTEAEMFFQGHTAMRIHGIWDRPGLWSPIHFDWDVLPFPSGPHGDRVTTYGAQLIGISAQTKHPEAARRFIRFYLSREANLIHMRSGSFMPMYREMIESSDVNVMPPDSPRTKRYYFETLDEGASLLPVIGPGVGELRRIIDDRLGQVSAEPDVPIPVILQTLEDEIHRWLVRQKQKGFYP